MFYTSNSFTVNQSNDLQKYEMLRQCKSHVYQIELVTCKYVDIPWSRKEQGSFFWCFIN